MNLAQLIAAVYTETNRPDLVPETLQAVLESTLSVHAGDSFTKDIQEAQMVFDNPLSYLQTLDLTSLPRYRSIAYIRKSNPSVNPTAQLGSALPPGNTYTTNQFNFLRRIDIDDAMDIYGREKKDIWYQAGGQINMKSATPLQYVRIAWYAYPNIDSTGAQFSSWIANEMPYAIIYRAAGSIFAKTGLNTEYQLFMKQPMAGHGDDTGGMFFQQLAILRRNNIIAQG